MGKVCLQIVSIITCFGLTGCFSLSFLSGRSDADRDFSDAAAFYYDGIPRVRPGVLLSVQVGATSGQTTSMQVQVDQKGDITLQYLLREPVTCDGLTLEALTQKLVALYQEYIHQPIVTVSFLPVDGNNGVSPYGTVNVLGEVGREGPVNMPATMDLTVTKAIQLAGGFKPFANKKRIKVTSCDKDGNRTVTYVNLKEIGEEGLISKDITLRAGDVVWVSETWY